MSFAIYQTQLRINVITMYLMLTEPKDDRRDVVIGLNVEKSENPTRAENFSVERADRL